MGCTSVHGIFRTERVLEEPRRYNANLAGANLLGGNLNFASLPGANLVGANFNNASLIDIEWGNTTCPDGTNSDNDGGTCVGHL